MPDAGPSSAQDSGTDSRVRGLVQAVLRYIGARGKLFQIEAQEAGSHVSKVSVRGVIALGCLLVAWLLSIPAIVSLGAEYLKPYAPWMRWEFMALILAGAHLFFGFIFLMDAKRRWGRVRLFEESLNQFEKDRAWVAHNQQPPN